MLEFSIGSDSKQVSRELLLPVTKLNQFASMTSNRIFGDVTQGFAEGNDVISARTLDICRRDFSLPARWRVLLSLFFACWR